MDSGDLLTLHDPAISVRLHNFMQRIDDSKVLQSQFVADPSTMIATEVFAGRAVGDVSPGNIFLFSLVSNESFRDWVDKIDEGLDDNIIEHAKADRKCADRGEMARSVNLPVNREAVYRQLVEGVQSFADAEGISMSNPLTSSEREPLDVADLARGFFVNMMDSAPTSGPGAVVIKVDGTHGARDAATSRAVLQRVANYIANEAIRRDQEQSL